VRFSVQHESGNSASHNECSCSNDNQGQGPGGQQGLHNKHTFLSSVGEIVISGVHVVESSSVVHLDQTSIEVLVCFVQLVTVVSGSVDICLVATILSQQLSHGLAIGLSNGRKPESQTCSVEERGVGGQPGFWGWGVGIERNHLNHVGSVSLVSSFSSVSSGVGITTSPLKVDIISSSDGQIVGSEIIFSGGGSLDHVASLSSDVEVENSVGGQDSRRSGSDVEHEGSVLEGSSKLRGINSQSHVGSTCVHCWVLSDGGISGTVGGVVNESSIRSVSVGAQVSSGNVVSDSECTIAVVTGNAREILCKRKSPVVVVGVESITSISKEVIS